MMTFTLSILLFLFLSFCKAQNITSYQGEQTVQDIRGSEIVVRSFDTRYEGIKGSPFLFSEWAVFKIVDGGNEYDIEAKLEANESKIIYKINNQLFEKSLNQLDNLYLILGKKTIPIVYLNKYKTGLIIENDKQEYQIVVVKQLRKANYKGAYSQDRPFDEYVTEVQLMECQGDQCKKLRGKDYSMLGISKKEIRNILGNGDIEEFEILIRELITP
ncbi:hypothetical protein [Ekhidna sp.]|uniref:hypothetical protein n=1 Tax=Ekhidna sp. TaxID=2608089 RepID=UPI003C7D3D20